MALRRRGCVVESEVLDSPASADDAQLDIAARAVRIVRARYNEGLRLQDVARELGCHRRTIERAFDSQLRLNFRDLLQGVRLRNAMLLLGQADAKVEVVALEVGFKSRSSLGKLLRRHGLPPPVRVKAARHRDR